MRFNLPFISVMTLAVGFSLISCASKPAESTEKSVKSEIIIEEPKVQNFVDWQYKGFGKDIPESAENMLVFIKPDASINDGMILDNERLVVFGTGVNSDQSVNVLEKGFKKILEEQEFLLENKELTLVEEYWVKVNQEVWKTDKPYMAIRVFEIN